MKGTVVIDCFPESAYRYKEDHTIVVTDVIRATTTAVTAIYTGRPTYIVKTSDEAFVLASQLDNPLLVGELGGNMPYGFDLTNSPVLLSNRHDYDRPMILVSSSGTQLLLNSSGAEAVYVNSMRNLSAIAEYILGRHTKVALLGAGSRGQFRREDQIGCAWLGAILVKNGFTPINQVTEELIDKWHHVDPLIITKGRSAKYLIDTDQKEDLDFIIKHIDDLTTVPVLVENELHLAHV